MAKNKPLNLSFISQLVVNGGLNHIEAQGNDILAQAQIDCPVDNDFMRSSGKLIREDSKMRVSIGFGKGVSKNYTAYQHENVGLHHKVGKAKWLQNAFTIKTNKMQVSKGGV